MYNIHFCLFYWINILIFYGGFSVIQQIEKLKVLDKKRLIERQNEQRIKYGLKPHKRLDADFLYQQRITEWQTKKELQKEDIWRSYQ